ncbi:hypothetical protein OIU84_007780 [Salix udensis]|uniref:Uncharacterized protein n=1 Tax=Salix udensis TaxID=889485 RepID=A0AAD6JTV2_9ROSI|nr:hypothetical protein OIU84_007780 [Salix udensis]
MEILQSEVCEAYLLAFRGHSMPSEGRYCQSLGGCVHKIYKKKKDLLLFSEEDEDELPNSVLNREDSNPPRKEEIERDEMDDNNRINDSASAVQSVWSPKQQPKAMKPNSDPLRKLAKRKEQRRARFDVVLDTPMTGN